MKAVILEIGGKPMLWHIMKLYSAHGIDEFVICLGYKGYLIKEYFANYYMHTCDVSFDLASGEMEVHRSQTEPWRVTLVDTGEGTMTGGRLKRVLPYVGGEDFCFTYGDGVADIDITALIAFHREQGPLHGQPPAVTADAVAGQDPVARHDDRDGVLSVGLPDGARPLGSPDPTRQHAVADRLAVGDARQLRPDLLLERGAVELHRDVEFGPLPGEVFLELRRRVLEHRRRIVPRGPRHARLAGQPDPDQHLPVALQDEAPDRGRQRHGEGGCGHAASRPFKGFLLGCFSVGCFFDSVFWLVAAVDGLVPSAVGAAAFCASGIPHRWTMA